jgi:3-oxoacyl-[acyl-carrier protein] reductase
MALGLRGKVAAITGASAGIGRATAFRCREEGVPVAICACREDVSQQAAKEIDSATGGAVLAVGADVTKAAECERFIQQPVDRFRCFDILVNHAGPSSAMPFAPADDEVWRADSEAILDGAMRCTRPAIPHLPKQGRGRIIDMITIAGQEPGARSVPSGVMRAAGIHLIKALANDYAADNSLINTVCLRHLKSAPWTRRWQAPFPRMTLDEFYSQAGRVDPVEAPGRVGSCRRSHLLPGLRTCSLYQRNRHHDRWWDLRCGVMRYRRNA